MKFWDTFLLWFERDCGYMKGVGTGLLAAGFIWSFLRETPGAGWRTLSVMLLGFLLIAISWGVNKYFNG